MNYQGIKKKLLRFKSIFTAHWAGFMASHPHYDIAYYQAEIELLSNLVFKTVIKQRSDLTQLPQYHP